jgi:hypothetical protein
LRAEIGRIAQDGVETDLAEVIPGEEKEIILREPIPPQAGMAREERAAGPTERAPIQFHAGDLVRERAGPDPPLEQAVDRAGKKGSLAAGGVEEGVRGFAHRPAGQRFGERGRGVVSPQGARRLHSG